MPEEKRTLAKYPIWRYLNVRDANSPSFSSDGRRIAFLSNVTGMPQVWQVRLSPQLDGLFWPDQLTFETNRVMGVWCSPRQGDERMIFARDVGGSEKAQLFMIPQGGGPEILLTSGYEDAMHIFGEWANDGSSIVYAANRRDPGLFDLYIQRLDGEARMVWRNDEPGFLFNSVFSPDGKRVLTVRMASSFRHEIFEIDLERGEAKLVSPPGKDARYNAVAYASDGRSLYVNTDLGSDFLHIARMDLESSKMRPIFTLDWNVEFMTLSPDGRRLGFVINADGASELQVLDISSGEVRTATGLGDVPGVVAVLELAITFSRNSERIAFSYTSATHAQDVHVWDLPTDRVVSVTRSSHGGLPLDSFVAPELIHYPTFDEDESGKTRQIPAWFYKPLEYRGGPMPVIVYVHGGPESQFKPFFHFFIQYCLNHGYSVLAPNVRGSTGYGKTYSHLDDVRKRMDSVADLAHAAHWLKSQPDVDGDRLVVMGGSYGGFMVLSALTTYPDLWAAGVEVVGISSFVTFLENTSDYRRAHREAEYGSLEDDRDFLESISPLSQVEKIAVPLMVIHGANDPRVPLGEAEQMVAALKAREIPTELIVFDDEGHGLVRLKNKLVAYPAIVEFLDKHLLG